MRQIPPAAEMPLREPRTRSGKVREGSKNVVLLGPKLLNKNVRLSSVEKYTPPEKKRKKQKRRRRRNKQSEHPKKWLY